MDISYAAGALFQELSRQLSIPGMRGSLVSETLHDGFWFGDPRGGGTYLNDYQVRS
jgi:hypothetical protein